MYLKYCLVTIPVILLISWITYLYLNKKGMGDKHRKNHLLLSTVIAIGFTLLIPVLAKTLAEALYVSIFNAILLAFLAGALIIGIGFIVFGLLVKKRATDSEEKTQPENSNILKSLLAGKAGQTEIPPDSDNVISINEQKNVDTDQITDRIGIEENTAGIDAVAGVEPSILNGLEEAQVYKNEGKLNESISCYRQILSNKPDEMLAALIIIEICSLAKKLNNIQFIYDLLESEQGSLLDLTIKAEILNNI